MTAIAAGLEPETSVVERAVAMFLETGRLLDIVGHDPDGAPLYTTLQV